MATAPSSTLGGRPRFFLDPILLDRIAFALTLAAAAMQYALLAYGFSTGGLIGLTIALVGALLSRRWPWVGLIIVVVGPLIDTALSMQVLGPWTMAVFTAFSVTIRTLPPLGVGAIVGIPAYGSIVVADGVGFINPTAFAAMAFAFTAAAAGSAVRAHFQYWRELEQRTHDAVATRESEANRRVAQERLRIARDLHDVVGHEIAVLNVHVGVAEVNLPAGALDTRRSLDAARTSIQAILQETQRILHVLRADDTPEADALRPAPELSGVPALISSFQTVGLEVEAQIRVGRTDIDPEVSTAAYRVVQEALTNAQKHGAGVVHLAIDESDGIVTIAVYNVKRGLYDYDGRSRGFGLVGMRERVTSAGGRLHIEDDTRTFTILASMRADGGPLR